jgi:hypothetical protein
MIPTVYTPKLSTLHTFCSMFFQLKTKFEADVLYFKVCHFLGAPKSQMEQHTLVLSKTLLRITCAAVLFQAAHDHRR